MSEITGTEARDRVKALVEDIDITMLTTVDAAGRLASRPMSTRLDTPDIALLKVTPVETEFWEPAHGRLVMAAGMLKALVTRDAPDDTMNHGKLMC
ncbi:hypothetical protein GCM10023065_09820 [Microbacterium laevaniformans]|uniref:Pyridoxamine 5'-phosphate oxidase n=1 Tax=Microbacterium laevaniformans TaxID=36807 RepID=A0A150HFD1_9MICO|nr:MULTISPECIES: hypothetical protein [Microbacterium]KXZ60654.1 hypothetical protein Mlaev_01307 [Microbacterium laevaniformans]MBM7751932.1 general stress protein 26 [Microbacterium laevaniformans]ODT22840.1 MAG: hypothetical protein ABS64_11540 [Microbacterium sp. SCN 69-37]OJU43369.1 MAG: hypothetical protein BGN98_10775 [Microbacterium sp. 69-7]GLJ65162.1 hypothetical protein GCM10017578_20510 [Microbacterium laevaniformans]